MFFLAQSYAIFHKDLLTEIRSKERLSSMCFFALLVLLIFSFALTPGSPAMQRGAAGIFWVTVVFSGLLGLTRSFTQEQTNDCMLGLLLAPTDRGAIFLGKMMANLVTMALMEIILLPLFALLLNVPVLPALPAWIPILVLGTVGFASIGTLFSAMSANTRLKEAMMPLLTLPVLVPILLASVEASSAILAGSDLESIKDWLKIAAAFSVLFSVLCLILFDFVVEE